MSNNDAAHLILRDSAVHNDTEAQQDPRQVRRLEDQQSKEAEHCIRVFAAPDVDEGAGERRAQERHAEHGRNA